MTPETHSQLASFIWSICNLLRGPYKRNEYRKVILPLTVLRRFDCLLAPTKAAALAAFREVKGRPESIVRHKLQEVTGWPFYNLSKLDFATLLDDPNQLAPNLNAYINAFSPDVRRIMERFAFDQQIARMNEKNILYEVVKAFCDPKLDLSDERVDNVQMGYVFEELIRVGAEQANEEAGEHFTPREVIKLMVNLLLSPEQDLARHHVVKTIYDPACGTGGMLSVAEKHIRELNTDARPLLFGQDWNDESWAVCRSDMLIKAHDAERIVLGDTFTADGFPAERFDYMLANPPFGVTWKQQQRHLEREKETLGYDGRFGAGLPRINDGSLLFLQHMISKMRAPADGGSRIAIVFNGSPLFTGDAGSGESEIRRWIIENDWLEAIVALPDQLFYNTGIATYIWLLTNRKDPERKWQGAAHRRPPLLRQDEAEPRQQAPQDRRSGRGRPRPDRRDHPPARQLHRRRDARPPGQRRHRRAGGLPRLRQRRLRLPQDHRRAPPAPQLPGHARAHRPPRGAERLRQPGQTQEETRGRPPARDRGRPRPPATDPRAA
jgi:type I restriction enzyme M protein